MRPVQPVQFVCLRCPHEDGLPLVRGSSRDDIIQCPTCGTAYHTQILYLLENADEMPMDRDHLRSQYGLTCEKDNGEVEYKRIAAQSGIPHFRAGETVLMVSHRGRLVEIANQTTEDWQRIFLSPERLRGPFLLVNAAIASYIIYWMYKLWPDLGSATQVGLVMLVLWALIVPSLSWVLRPISK